MLVESLQAASLLSGGMIAGSMVYESIVEVGVRKATPARDQLENWRRCFPAASGIFKPLGFVTSALFALTGFMSGEALWYVAALLTFALGPITWLFIAPTNTILLNMDDAASDEEITATVAKWGQRHHIRTALLCASFLLAIYIVIWR